MADTGPADALRRAVRRRSSLVRRRTATFSRIDALLELLGPSWAEVLGGGEYTKTAIMLLTRTGANPHTVKKIGRNRLADLLTRASCGHWRHEHAAMIIQAADDSLALRVHGGIDFAELADDLKAEARMAGRLTEEIEQLEDRIQRLYDDADPDQIVISAPGLRTTLAAGILGRLGDPNRFANLPAVRSFTGLVPSVDQSGTIEHYGPPTKAGDPGLREALVMAADKARKIDPTMAARYHDLVVVKGKHHTSALCTLAAVLVTRIAACWRTGTCYQLNDTDGTPITDEQGREICQTCYKVTAADRAKRRSTRRAQHLKNRTQGTSRRTKESHSAPAASPSHTHHTQPGTA